mgnify:CR=1 FL=1
MKTEMPDLSARAATFHKGERVEMTKKARRMFPTRSPFTGRVFAEPSNQLRLSVLRDGLKYPTSWHSSFWRKVKPKKGK